MSNDKQQQDEETSAPQRRKPPKLPHPFARVSRSSHSAVSPHPPPPHRCDASRHSKDGESQRWPPTPERRSALACCALTAETHPTAPRPHGHDALVRSENWSASARPPSLAEQPRGAEQSAWSWHRHQRRELWPAQWSHGPTQPRARQPAAQRGASRSLDPPRHALPPTW